MVARTQNEPKRLGIIRGVSERIVFLPAPLRNFIKHRLLEITGLIIIIFDISFAILLSVEGEIPKLDSESANDSPESFKRSLLLIYELATAPPSQAIV